MLDVSQSPSHPRYHARAAQACTARFMYNGFKFSFQRSVFSPGNDKGPRAPACERNGPTKQAGLNFHVDSEGADHVSVSRSDPTLNVYNYALQMHLCLQLFPGCLSGSVLEIPRLAEEVSRCWEEALCSRSCPTQSRKNC